MVNVLAYADDIAVISPDPVRSLIAIQQLAALFGERSGFKLNVAKTQIVCTEQTRMNDPRVREEATYLGIRVNSCLDKMVLSNWDSLVRKIKRDLDRIKGLHLSMVGRCNVLKMDVLPKVIYYFRYVPLELTGKQIQRLQSICSSFLWA